MNFPLRRHAKPADGDGQPGHDAEKRVAGVIFLRSVRRKQNGFCFLSKTDFILYILCAARFCALRRFCKMPRPPGLKSNPSTDWKATRRRLGKQPIDSTGKQPVDSLESNPFSDGKATHSREQFPSAMLTEGISTGTAIYTSCRMVLCICVLREGLSFLFQ
jgi:hypothetical protein